MQQFANRDLKGWCTPTAEFNLVYLLVHMYRHLFHEGVGLRQVMDYYFVLQNSMEVDRKNALLTIRELGLEYFVGGVMHVLKVVFGLTEAQMLCQQNDRHGVFLLKEIMLSGNMGHYDERLKDKDKRRAAYHRFYTDMKWGHAQNYHLCLDSGVLGIDKCADLIAEMF